MEGRLEAIRRSYCRVRSHQYFFLRVWNAINVIKVPLPRHYVSPAVWSETPKFLLLKTVSTVFLYNII